MLGNRNLQNFFVCAISIRWFCWLLLLFLKWRMHLFFVHFYCTLGRKRCRTVLTFEKVAVSLMSFQFKRWVDRFRRRAIETDPCLHSVCEALVALQPILGTKCVTAAFAAPFGLFISWSPDARFSMQGILVSLAAILGMKFLAAITTRDSLFNGLIPRNIWRRGCYFLWQVIFLLLHKLTMKYSRVNMRVRLKTWKLKEHLSNWTHVFADRVTSKKGRDVRWYLWRSSSLQV